jgi:hypothetical protein
MLGMIGGAVAAVDTDWARSLLQCWHAASSWLWRGSLQPARIGRMPRSASSSGSTRGSRPGEPAAPAPAMSKITLCRSPAAAQIRRPTSNGRQSRPRGRRTDGSGRVAPALELRGDRSSRDGAHHYRRPFFAGCNLLWTGAGDRVPRRPLCLGDLRAPSSALGRISPISARNFRASRSVSKYTTWPARVQKACP